MFILEKNEHSFSIRTCDSRMKESSRLTFNAAKEALQTAKKWENP